MANHSHIRAGRTRLHVAPVGEDAVNAIVTQAKGSGGFDFPTGVFRLRDGVSKPGNYPLALAIEDVTRDWLRQSDEGSVWIGTVNTYSAKLNGFANYAKYKGLTRVSDLNAKTIAEWVASPTITTGEPVSTSTYNERLSTVRTFFRTLICLGITDSTPSFSVPRRKQNKRHVDPYTATEIQKLKDTAEPKNGEEVSKSAVCLALALLGASSGEIGNIYYTSFSNSTPVISHFDIVKFEGGGPFYVDRWVPLDDTWANNILLRRLDELKELHPDSFQQRGLAYQPAPGNGNTFQRRSAATSGLLSRLIRDAGVNKGRSARTASITEYLALRIYDETTSIEQVASRLGMKDLNRAAHIVNPDWFANNSLVVYNKRGQQI